MQGEFYKHTYREQSLRTTQKVFLFVLAKYKVFVFANNSCILQIHVENEASLVLLLVELIINLWQGFILQAVVAKFS